MPSQRTYCVQPSWWLSICSNAPRKSLSLTHGVPQAPQSTECHSGKLSKSIAFASAARWRGHCCGGGVVSGTKTRLERIGREETVGISDGGWRA